MKRRSVMDIGPARQKTCRRLLGAKSVKFEALDEIRGILATAKWDDGTEETVTVPSLNVERAVTALHQKRLARQQAKP